MQELYDTGKNVRKYYGILHTRYFTPIEYFFHHRSGKIIIDFKANFFLRTSKIIFNNKNILIMDNKLQERVVQSFLKYILSILLFTSNLIF